MISEEDFGLERWLLKVINYYGIRFISQYIVNLEIPSICHSSEFDGF